MSNKPLISIIINCFNSEQYLAETINSVIEQVYENWEIIFWDNQSTDKSAEIFKAYNDKRFKYFYAPTHTVLGEARNLAAAESKAEWIAFLDADDLWLPDKLIKQINIALSSLNIGCVYGRTLILRQTESNINIDEIVEETGRYAYKKLPDGDIFSILTKTNIIPLVSALIKKSIFVDLGGCDTKLQFCEDYDMFLKIADNHRFGVVQSPCCYYRVHQKNLSRSIMELGYTESISILQAYHGHKNIKEAIIVHRLRHVGYLVNSGKILKSFSQLAKIGFNVFLIFYSIMYLVAFKKRSNW